jgi:hypothetical protein
MATEGHGRGQKGDRKKNNSPDMDLEFNQIREQTEELTFKMQQSAKEHWV